MAEPKDMQIEPTPEVKAPPPWETARAAARAAIAAQGLTAAQVRSLDYRGTAALFGVQVDAKTGNRIDADWFSYSDERQRLAQDMDADAEAATLTELRLAVQAAVDSKLAAGKSPVLTDDAIKALVGGLQ